MVRVNLMKKKLVSGGSVFGTWSMFSSPSVMNVIGTAGLDFAIIDMEHGPTSFETAENQIYATESAGCTPIIRLGDGSDQNILRALEVGAQAIMVPHVATVEEAKRIVEASKYPPEGSRGLSPFTRAHGYSDVDMQQKLCSANEQMFVGVLIEGEDGMRNLPQIAKVPGLDLIYLGLYDLSQAMGFAGQLEHPNLLKILREFIQVIEEAGVIAGSVARDKAYLKILCESGFRFLAYRVDCAILREGFETARQWYDEMTGEKR